MKLKYILLLTVIVGFSIWGCSKKSSDSTPTNVDLPTSASGTYTGTFGSGPATVLITKESTTTVVLKLTDDVNSVTNVAGVGVSDGGGGKILLSLPTGNTPISGTVNGKSLDCYFYQLHFVGTKP